jgi:tetratricopeptide (TPR) repeat protein
MISLRRAVLHAAGWSILCCAVIVGAEDGHWQKLVDAGNGAVQKHEFAAAKKFFGQALTEAERSGLEDPRVGKSFKLLGDLYFAQQKYDEAKVYYSRAEAVEGYTGNLRMAEMEFAAGDYAGAKTTDEMGLKQMESKVGRNDVLLTPYLISLGKSERALLQETEAAETLNRAIKMLQSSGTESRELASALDLLGEVFDDQNKYADAEPLLKRSLDIRQKILEADDPQLETSFDDLAEHYRRMGRSADAETFQKQASTIRDRDLLNVKEYVDKVNGFRLRIPKSWSSSPTSLSIQVPGALVAFQSSDLSHAVMVQRVPIPPGSDSSVYDSLGQNMAAMGKGEEEGEENVALSGLPARRVMMALVSGKLRLRDWVTLLVSQNQLWLLHVIGPEEAMSSPDTSYYRAAQSIGDSFAFLDPALQVIKAQALVPPPPLRTITGDAEHCRHYLNREVAMQVLFPDGWQESGQSLPSFREGKTVVLNRVGTLAVVILGREELEASPELYLKTLQGSLREATESLQQISEEKVTRQGHAGTRMVLVTRENGIDYRYVLEVFSDGIEHFRVIARAPTEVFSRYASDFDDMLQSVEFFAVAGQPPVNNPMPLQITTAPKP